MEETSGAGGHTGNADYLPTSWVRLMHSYNHTSFQHLLIKRGMKNVLDTLILQAHYPATAIGRWVGDKPASVMLDKVDNDALNETPHLAVFSQSHGNRLQLQFRIDAYPLDTGNASGGASETCGSSGAASGSCG